MLVPDSTWAQSGEIESVEDVTPSDAPSASPAAPETPEELARLADIESRLERHSAAAEEWISRAREYAQVRETAPSRLEAIQAELDRDATGDGVLQAADAAIEDLEAALLDAEQDLVVARKEESSLQAEATRRPDRRRQIPVLLADAKARLKTLEQSALSSNGDHPAIAQALKALASARLASTKNEIEAYQGELVTFDIRGQLLRKQLDLAGREISETEARVEALNEAVRKRRDFDAKVELQRARQTAADASTLPESVQDLIATLARENAELAKRRTGEKGLPEKIDSVRKKLARAEARVATLDSDFARLVEKVQAAGLSDSVGLLLRKQRSEIPDVGKYRRFIRMRQELITEVQLAQIEWEDRRRELAKVDRVIERAMSELEMPLEEADRVRIEGILRELLETKRGYIDDLVVDYETYFEKLVDFDSRQQELVERSVEVQRYIDERVLWIPSSEAFRSTFVADLWTGVSWLLSPKFAEQLVRALGRVFVRAPMLSIVVVLLALFFVSIRSRILGRLEHLATEARRLDCIRDVVTWEAFFLSLVLTLWLPGLLAYLGWQLSISPEATQYVRCVAYGASSAALVWVSLGVPRELLRKDGLFEAHFDAPESATRNLRWHLKLLMTIAIPAVFVIQTFELRNEDIWRESVGRLAFLIAMVPAVVALWVATRDPNGSLWQLIRPANHPEVRRWIRRLAGGSALAGGVFLIGGAIRGYYWTALELASSFLFTLVCLFVLMTLYRIFVRWSLLAQRRLARAKTKEFEAGEALDPTTTLDLETVDAQTNRLVKSTTAVVFVLGMWLIWSDLLPAVGILREVELWTSTVSATVELTDASGITSFSAEERVVPVTLADLLLATILAVMTLVTVRNLPGLLEITVFRRLAPGERYAYGTIAKYAVSVIGIAVVFNAVGVGWSNIQWLVAAVGLGLGFGLQEIFANFISGLIILFERPIRVGDTVTVGNVSGVVSRIRIRATWITGFDRKELIVPNKDFVTTQLINWSLSDAVSRIEIKVGVAYGSDTTRVIELLHEVAAANREVLRDPPPQALFLGFGESSLDFELRAFSPDVDRRLPIIHALHMGVDQAFREAGIEIAFPQRDLHIRTP
jgi:potassium efflux system protein